jgi:hypothetical protein
MHLRPFFSLFCAAGLAVGGPTLRAVPLLQLYIEGAVYDSATQSWDTAFTSGGTVRLWAIGNISGEGGHGPISNVRLAVAYDHVTSGATPVITLTSTRVDSTYSLFGDANISPTASWQKTVTNGAIPLLSDGSTLPSHGEYGPGTDWQEFLLGDFTTPDSYGGDFMTALPTPSGLLGYQINAYEISIAGIDRVHFDLYDSIQAGNKARAIFAPFSHDASAGQDGGFTPSGNASPVPDGGLTLGWIGLAMSGVVFARRYIGTR